MSANAGAIAGINGDFGTGKGQQTRFCGDDQDLPGERCDQRRFANARKVLDQRIAQRVFAFTVPLGGQRRDQVDVAIGEDLALGDPADGPLRALARLAVDAERERDVATLHRAAKFRPHRLFQPVDPIRHAQAQVQPLAIHRAQVKGPDMARALPLGGGVRTELGEDHGKQPPADKIVDEGLSVRAAEAAAAEGPQRKVAKPRAGGVQAQLGEIADRLGDRFDTRVAVKLGAKKGQIVIDFANVADLNRILGVLGIKREN